MRAALFVTVLLACQADPARPAAAIVVRDAGGDPLLTLTVTAHGCTAEPPATTITVAGSVTSAGAWRLAPGPAGRELSGPAGVVARLVDEPGPPRRISLLDPIGVPRFRLTAAVDQVSAVGPARDRIALISAAPGGAITVAPPTGGADDDGDRRVLARVTGTADLVAAALLTVPATDLPTPARALLACQHLTSSR